MGIVKELMEIWPNEVNDNSIGLISQYYIGLIVPKPSI